MSPLTRTLPVLLVLLPLTIGALERPLRQAPGGQPLLDATTANGRTVACLFDTGATQSVLAPSLLDPTRDRRLGEIAATGAGGTGRFASWQVRGWQLGDHELPPFSALAADLGASTPCVIGPAAIHEARIELDFIAQRLRAGAVLTTLGQSLQYTAVQGFIRLRVPFPGGGEATWILDTGAGTSVLNRRAAALLGLDPERPARWVERRGLDGLRRQHRVHAVAALELLPGAAPLSRVEVAELPVLKTLGIDGSAPGGLLGADALQGRRWILDLDRQQLLLVL